MTIADYCLFVAAILPILTIGIAKYSARRTYDNANPRNPEFYRHPFRARVLGAHSNGLEAFPFFAAAVLLAEFRHVPQVRLDELALAFVALRIVYVGVYLSNLASARSIVWALALACNIWIFFLPMFGA
jgi:uncharacterized MAPEG superfamily protein